MKLIKLIIRKIFGHKYDCCSHITKRCKKCPLYLTDKEAAKVKKSIKRDGYIDIRRRDKNGAVQ